MMLKQNITCQSDKQLKKLNRNFLSYVKASGKEPTIEQLEQYKSEVLDLFVHLKLVYRIHQRTPIKTLINH